MSESDWVAHLPLLTSSEDGASLQDRSTPCACVGRRRNCCPARASRRAAIESQSYPAFPWAASCCASPQRRAFLGRPACASAGGRLIELLSRAPALPWDCQCPIAWGLCTPLLPGCGPALLHLSLHSVFIRSTAQKCQYTVPCVCTGLAVRYGKLRHSIICHTEESMQGSRLYPEQLNRAV